MEYLILCVLFKIHLNFFLVVNTKVYLNPEDGVWLPEL